MLVPQSKILLCHMAPMNSVVLIHNMVTELSYVCLCSLRFELQWIVELIGYGVNNVAFHAQKLRTHNDGYPEFEPVDLQISKTCF